MPSPSPWWQRRNPLAASDESGVLSDGSVQTKMSEDRNREDHQRLSADQAAQVFDELTRERRQQHAARRAKRLRARLASMPQSWRLGWFALGALPWLLWQWAHGWTGLLLTLAAVSGALATRVGQRLWRFRLRA